MSFSYNTAPGNIDWVDALFDTIQQLKAGTLDISNAYEQFGRYILPELVVQGASGPITALA